MQWRRFRPSGRTANLGVAKLGVAELGVAKLGVAKRSKWQNSQPRGSETRGSGKDVELALLQAVDESVEGMLTSPWDVW